MVREAQGFPGVGLFRRHIHKNRETREKALEKVRFRSFFSSRAAPAGIPRSLTLERCFDKWIFYGTVWFGCRLRRCHTPQAKGRKNMDKLGPFVIVNGSSVALCFVSS